MSPHLVKTRRLSDLLTSPPRQIRFQAAARHNKRPRGGEDKQGLLGDGHKTGSSCRAGASGMPRCELLLLLLLLLLLGLARCIAAAKEQSTDHARSHRWDQNEQVCIGQLRRGLEA